MGGAGLVAACFVVAVAGAAVEPPAPLGACPSPAQVAWHRLEMYGFIHFTTNTFTDREWGNGDEPASVFNPAALDCAQWARVAKSAGMKGLILTAKHHDGFCLWPSPLTEHSVINSPWREGTGDVVREFVDACRAQGLLVGLYLSPWDRHHAEYGRPAYIDYYRAQLRELITGYGPLFEVWFDGANGGSGYYGGARETRKIDGATYYGWPDTNALVLSLNPDAIIFSDAGPGCRWVGNEAGYSDEESWQTLNAAGMYPGVSHDHLARGDRNGTHWVGVEVDVSIRPGWFWHEKENDKVKTPEKLVDIWYDSVGRGANLLLNIPPDRRGLIHEIDARNLAEFGRILRETFATDLARGKPAAADQVRGGKAGREGAGAEQDNAVQPAGVGRGRVEAGGAEEGRFGPAAAVDGDPDTYWATDDGVTSGTLTIDLGGPTTFDVVRVCEYIPLGQRIERFRIEADSGSGWVKVCEGTTVGPRRVIRTERTTAERVRLVVERGMGCVVVSEVGVYRRVE